MDVDDDLIDGGTIGALFLEHGVDKLLETLRIDGLRWYAILDVENGQRTSTVLFKGGGVVAELVQQNTESPDVCLFVDDTALIYIDHLGSSILQGGVLVEVGFDSLDFVHTLCWLSGKNGCGGSEIA